MTASHLVFLVEEPSMEAFLRALLPRLLPEGCGFEIHAFQGKFDLLRKLQSRLSAYAHWLPADWRIIVLVDRDNDDCQALKRNLEGIAKAAGLQTPSRADGTPWRIVNRLAIEELEAWYFGDWTAVCEAYPRVSPTIPAQIAFRQPDAIRGGTWEAFQRILRRYGYFKTGLRKIEAARAIGTLIDPKRCQSPSFSAFCTAIAEAMVR